jgi:hypothetical protein
MRDKRSALAQIEFMRNLLAFLLIGAFIGAMGAFTFFVIPDANKDILTYMVGQLSGMALTVLGFYFVSKVGQDALDASRSENTGKALDAIKTVAAKPLTSTEALEDAVDKTAQAAVEEAEEQKETNS